MEQKLNDWMWKCQHCCKLRIYWWMSVIRFVPFPGSPTLHCNQWGSVKYIFSIQVEPLFERWVHSTTIPAWIPVQKWRSVFSYLNIGGNMSNWSNSCMVKNKDQIPTIPDLIKMYIRFSKLLKPDNLKIPIDNAKKMKTISCAGSPHTTKAGMAGYLHSNQPAHFSKKLMIIGQKKRAHRHSFCIALSVSPFVWF